MNAFPATVLADTWADHHDMGTGGWILMMLGMVIFWGAIIALVVWVTRGGSRSPRTESPEDVLRRRLADGSITVEQHEQRRAALHATSAPDARHPTGPAATGHRGSPS